MNPVKRTKKQACGGDNNRDDKEIRREPATQQKNNKEKAIRKAMQQVLGQQDVRFQSAEQELALHAVINRQTPFVVVLPTSRGKSLLFSVLACIEDAGVTAVVVPYQALIKDLVDRMQKCSINYIKVRKHTQRQGAAAAGGGGRVSSCHHVERLAAEAGTAEESPAAAVSDRAAYRNAPAGKRRRAGNEHAASVRNIHLSEYCLAEYAVLRVVVRAWQGAGDGADDVSTTAAAAARQGREGSGVLPQQAAVASGAAEAVADRWRRQASWREGGCSGAGGEGQGGADDEAEERRLGRAGDGRVYYWQQVSARADERLLGRQAGRVQQLRDSWVRLMRRRGLRVARRAERSERRVAAGARRAR
ncbi:hypothetical protein OPT61_g8267 [Boeremia exigua]|uniref:Uncharacterized protein n=1 Tax=Boeremia exigua TaxID=749465 RepID=A0ACC2HYZ3_9PLEO|nr:hypothetical protein OPT61_g8267 [Boeremia exigua]